MTTLLKFIFNGLQQNPKSWWRPTCLIMDLNVFKGSFFRFKPCHFCRFSQYPPLSTHALLRCGCLENRLFHHALVMVPDLGTKAGRFTSAWVEVRRHGDLTSKTMVIWLDCETWWFWTPHGDRDQVDVTPLRRLVIGVNHQWELICRLSMNIHEHWKHHHVKQVPAILVIWVSPKKTPL